MSEIDTFEWEGNPVEPDEDATPDEAHEDDAGGDVELVGTGALRGQLIDRQSGSRFVRGVPVTVGAEHAERLLAIRHRGLPVLVRTDS